MSLFRDGLEKNVSRHLPMKILLALPTITDFQITNEAYAVVLSSTRKRHLSLVSLRLF